MVNFFLSSIAYDELAYCDGLLIASGSGNTRMKYSIDGLGWSDVSDLGTVFNFELSGLASNQTGGKEKKRSKMRM